MAAAYASLLSILQILDDLKNHPRPPISLDQHQLQSLTQNVTFLQDFLQLYSNHVGYTEQVDAIADAAHAVEDVIESRIVDRILADGEDSALAPPGQIFLKIIKFICKEVSSTEFYEAMQKVIDDMELVKREIMDMRENLGVESSTIVASTNYRVASDSVGQKQIMVGFDDVLLKVLDKLRSHECSRQIISITGMGGIGKTTLARNVYKHELVVQHFDFLFWFTISQEFDFAKTIRKVLKGYVENLSQVDENDLGCKLHQMLSWRRYLVIIDDIWNVEDWDRLQLFLPDNNNGSRIIITTRLSNLARQIDDSHNNIVLDFMDEDNSWKLFSELVFGKEADCPLELKEIGLNIVRRCKGLPLSISVVGGLLAKSNRTQEYWEHVEENLNSVVNLEHDERCLQILYMSYNSLPLHLKPCFLLTGCSFGEDEEVPLGPLIQMWVGEGFVRPIYGKTLEEAAQEYVAELVDRNLLFMNKEENFGFAYCWLLRSCSIHDLLRDLCLREAEKQNFLINVVGNGSLNHNNRRRIYMSNNTPQVEEEVLPILESASLVRSLLSERTLKETSLSSFSFRLLRVHYLEEDCEVINSVEYLVSQVNLRFILLRNESPNQYIIPSSIYRFWNLQTLIITGGEFGIPVIAPIEIWNMPQLRLVIVPRGLCLPDPPPDYSMVMENLHTLADLQTFNCSEQVVKRIPHLKTLIIRYVEVGGSSSLSNLGRLQQLETLVIDVDMESQTVVQTITFPRSLKILELSGTRLRWDYVTTNIGSLPLLLTLVLLKDACIGDEWETVEGQFCSLECLGIAECGDLEYWMSETTHFPRLQHLVLQGLLKLNEIPLSIGDIPTLQSITVLDCSHSAADSAETIRTEQHELGNEDLQVQVYRLDEHENSSQSSEDSSEDQLSRTLRASYNLEEAPCGDSVTHFFCHLCAICQEYREIRERSPDPNSGSQNMVEVAGPPVQKMESA